MMAPTRLRPLVRLGLGALCLLLVGTVASTRAQTPPGYQAGIRVEQWEVPLVEVVVQPASDVTGPGG